MQNKKTVGPEKEKTILNLKPVPRAKPQSGFLDMVREQASTDLSGGLSPNGVGAGFNYNAGAADIGASALVPLSSRVHQNPNRFAPDTYTKGAPDLERARANIYARNLMDKNLNLQGTIDRDKNWNVSADYRPTESTEIRAALDNDQNYNVGLKQKIADNLALKANYDKERGVSGGISGSAFNDKLNAYLEARQDGSGSGVAGNFGVNYRF